MANLIGVPSTDIYEYWGRVEPFVSAACQRHGLMTAEWVKHQIEDRNWQLWVAVDGDEIIAVGITEIRAFPLGSECDLIIGTGKKRGEWQHFRANLEQWAKAQGCTRMRVYARTGWLRIFKDYVAGHIILTKELTHE